VAEKLLAVSNLAMQFGGLKALNDISLAAAAGDITAIIGPNGAGKTTLFNCLTGFYRPTSGSITLNSDGHRSIRLDRLAGHQIAAQAHVARTFQNIRLFANMTVLENLLVAQHAALRRAGGTGLRALFGLPRARAAERAAIDRAIHWLTATDLLARADDPAGALPYGAQRRLEIARALCTEPILLCLDEPAAGLNPRESDELATLLLTIRAAGTAILLIEHDMRVVMRISDHIIVLDHGRKIAEGPPAVIRANPTVIAAYLGEPETETAAA
jgi:branched-chain amino acid transport system ATP-binding protein